MNEDSGVESVRKARVSGSRRLLSRKRRSVLESGREYQQEEPERGDQAKKAAAAL